MIDYTISTASTDGVAHNRYQKAFGSFDSDLTKVVNEKGITPLTVGIEYTNEFVQVPLVLAIVKHKER